MPAAAPAAAIVVAHVARAPVGIVAVTAGVIVVIVVAHATVRNQVYAR